MKPTEWKSPHYGRPFWDARQLALFVLLGVGSLLFIVLYVALSILGVKDEVAFSTGLVSTFSLIFGGHLFLCASEIKKFLNGAPTQSGYEEVEISTAEKAKSVLSDLEHQHQRVTKIIEESQSRQLSMIRSRAKLIKMRGEFIARGNIFRRKGMLQAAQQCRDNQVEAESILREIKDLDATFGKIHAEAMQLILQIEKDAAVTEGISILLEKMDSAVTRLGSTSKHESTFTVHYEGLSKDLGLATVQ